jgi:5'-nucleotidase/2',3'-cyclic phosphodiesterase and related esterases
MRAYGELSNLFTDAMMAVAPNAKLALTNSGGLREDLNAGPNTPGDIISAFTQEKNKQVRGGYTLSDATIEYLKNGNKVIPEQVNEKRVTENE